MKNLLVRLLAAAGVMALPLLTSAAPAILGGHYPAGAEGIKGASLPPPGVYFKDYNFFYFANEFKGPQGPPVFDVFAYVNAPRLIWMTDLKVLEANYGMDVIVPFGYTSVKAGGPGVQAQRSFGLADIQIEPLLLGWHWKQFDLSAAYAVWVPTGDFDLNDGSKQGKGFWSHMLTLGGTWFPDEEKTWAVSLLNRYEFHHQNNDMNVTPGQTLTVEWGLSKSLSKLVDVGVIGYYQQQTTSDRGDGIPAVVSVSNLKDRVVGVGPEITIVCPKTGIFTSLRYIREVEASDRSAGNLFTITFIKRF